MTKVIGGWKLTLTCPCSQTAVFTAVVPGLVLDAAARAGWDVEGPLVKPDTTREALCGACG